MFRACMMETRQVQQRSKLRENAHAWPTQRRSCPRPVWRCVGPVRDHVSGGSGADVLKIEPIGGDITRRSRATIDKDGEFSALFISSNRGKRSLSIDVKSAAGREVLAKLVAQADVLVQNFRPGTMDHLGLAVDELRQRHPRLIYVSISGVGDTGPYVKKRVYDSIIQGLSGFADIQSQPVTNRPQMIRTIVCDKTTAVFTAQAVAAALYAREKTGQGDHIQVAMSALVNWSPIKNVRPSASATSTCRNCCRKYSPACATTSGATP